MVQQKKYSVFALMFRAASNCFSEGRSLNVLVRGRVLPAFWLGGSRENIT